MLDTLKKIVRIVLGLFIFALGITLSVQANIGLAPWDAFSAGVSHQTSISFGTVVVLSGLVIIVVDILLKEKIGIGSILNAVLIGQFVDLIQSLQWIPKMNRFFPGVILMVFGLTLIVFGSYVYIGAGMGCGPRDALMVALGKRFPRLPIGVIRGLIEGTVLAIGFSLGAKVGIGTVISAFGIGFILQLMFRLLRFDVKNVKHENIADTFRQKTEPHIV